MSKLAEIILTDAESICQKINLNELKDKTILLTGASGLIGTYFLASIYCYLKNNNISINVCAVGHGDFSEHLSSFLDYPGAKIFQGDLTDTGFIKTLPKADYIIHAAGYGQPGRFMENQIKTIQLNTSTTIALLEKLLPNGKFLFASTSEVYSGLPNPPYKEDQIGTTNTTYPRSCYIEGKRCGEAICNAFRAQGVQAKSARLSLAYGPGTKIGDKRAINNFIYKGLQGKIDLLDGGEAKRTYCYITDAVEIMWHILLDGKEAIYNVGGNSKTTIADLAKKIGDFTGSTVVFPEVLSGKSLVGAPEDVVLDMSLVKNEFGKEDFVSFDDGLKRAIEWQKELYKI